MKIRDFRRIRKGSQRAENPVTLLRYGPAPNPLMRDARFFKSNRRFEKNRQTLNSTAKSKICVELVKAMAASKIR